MKMKMASLLMLITISIITCTSSSAQELARDSFFEALLKIDPTFGAKWGTNQQQSKAAARGLLDPDDFYAREVLKTYHDTSEECVAALTGTSTFIESRLNGTVRDEQAKVTNKLMRERFAPKGVTPTAAVTEIPATASKAAVCQYLIDLIFKVNVKVLWCRLEPECPQEDRARLVKLEFSQMLAKFSNTEHSNNGSGEGPKVDVQNCMLQFDQELEKNGEERMQCEAGSVWITILKVMGVIAAVALVALGVWCLCCRGGCGGKPKDPKTENNNIKEFGNQSALNIQSSTSTAAGKPQISASTQKGGGFQSPSDPLKANNKSAIKKNKKSKSLKGITTSTGRSNTSTAAIGTGGGQTDQPSADPFESMYPIAATNKYN